MIKKDTKIYCPICKEHCLTALKDINYGDPMYSVNWPSPRVTLKFGQRIECDLCGENLVDTINSVINKE